MDLWGYDTFIHVGVFLLIIYAIGHMYSRSTEETVSIHLRNLMIHLFV